MSESVEFNTRNTQNLTNFSSELESWHFKDIKYQRPNQVNAMSIHLAFIPEENSM